ncbi:hypothetical protein B6J70_18620 [Klebsiella pneumoniae]|nr:hypothetical protein B6J70_18620 [Klebsiella pneumoniae]
MHLSPPIMFGVLSVVSKRFRAVGLIYQQSAEGDSRDPENKKGHQMVTFIVPEYGYSDFNFSYDSFIF